MVYDLPVEDEKVKPHHITTLHLICSLAFMSAGAIIFRYNFDITIWGLSLLLAGVLLLLVTIFKNKRIISKKVNPQVRFIELLISVTMAVYSAIQGWRFPTGIFSVLSAAIVFAIYWERAGGSAPAIHIDDDGIRLPVTSRKRFLKWAEVEEVVMRFGTLSINCVDNRLFQWNIPGSEVDIETFEAYCAAKVEENISKRISDEW